MAKRLLDLVGAGLGLLLAAPALALAALGVRLASPGPTLYRARRVGRWGRPFTLYKLRTMHVGADRSDGRITAAADPRVFPLGWWLRRAKLDELPQLVNVLRGEMSLVGPRPEDPVVVQRHYAPLHYETLRVRPGLASPGSLFNYTHGDALLTGPDPDRAYVERVLPLKLALELVYTRHATVWYDLAIIGRTIWTIGAILLGRRAFRDPPELPAAQRLLATRLGVTQAPGAPTREVCA